MISKELLSEVLGIDKENIFDTHRNGLKFKSFIQIKNGNEVIDSPSIYDLIYQLKEWAKSKGYYVMTKQYEDGFFCYLNFDFTLDLSSKNIKCNLKGFDGVVHDDTEFLAVQKACEWIMEQTK